MPPFVVTDTYDLVVATILSSRIQTDLLPSSRPNQTHSTPIRPNQTHSQPIQTPLSAQKSPVLVHSNLHSKGFSVSQVLRPDHWRPSARNPRAAGGWRPAPHLGSARGGHRNPPRGTSSTTSNWRHRAHPWWPQNAERRQVWLGRALQSWTSSSSNCAIVHLFSRLSLLIVSNLQSQGCFRMFSHGA